MRTRRRRAATVTSITAFVLALLVVCATGGTALAADRWTDISDASWKDTYGLTTAQVAGVAEGFSDGTFRPVSSVLRGQFAKMSLSAFGLKTATPATPTFSDLLPTDFYFPWVEGGVAASIIAKAETYRPAEKATRAEASLLVAAYLAKKEIASSGKIVGRRAAYGSLADWYKAEGVSVLQYYKDKGDLTERTAPSVAYLAYHKVVNGAARNGKLYLDAASTLTRAQAVAFILRAKSAAFESVTKGAPKVTAVGPIRGMEDGGNTVVIVGSGFWGARSVAFGGTVVSSDGFTIDSQTQITVKKAPAGSGTVDVVVTTGQGKSATGAQDRYTYVGALTDRDLAVAEAIKYVGVPYVWAGESPNSGFDCSGFVMYVLAKLGVTLPHSSAAQSTMGIGVAVEQLQPGDLVFFYKPVHHVGMYIGNGNMINAPGTGAFVRIEKVWSSSYNTARQFLCLPPPESSLGD
jgi:cell wall-associated NlpC family hydrolase